jgi:hypothetical protein
MTSKYGSNFRRGAAACVLGLVLIFGPLLGRAGAVSEAEEKPTAELNHGTIGADQWWASLELPEDAQEREEGNVCVSIFFLEVWPEQERSEGSEVAQCGTLDTHDVLFQSSTVYHRSKRPHIAVAFLFDGSASRIVLKLKGMPDRHISLRHLSPQPVTGGKRVAYFARGYAGPVCVQRLIAYDSAGRRVARLGHLGCL